MEAWLLAHGYRVQPLSEHNTSGQYALILAAQQGRDDVVKYLLRQGADLNIVGADGNNTLWAACVAESNKCIAALLEAGIDVDFQNSNGATALTYASSRGKYKIVEQLLNAGANPVLTTHEDFCALDVASSRQCLQLLMQEVVNVLE